ncbi:MAG TPA: FtsX-like permease family protein [Deltaproteobacteria bacterium]|nr:FtsX-like permease family protein [Deltaproteobacteria bacterium]
MQVLKVAFRAIGANKLRTSLTMLGIIIGVGAIITMVAIGEGAKRKVTESISRIGTNLLRVRPGAARLGHIASGTVETLTLADARAVGRSIRGVKSVSPAVSNMGQVKYSNRNATTLITGTTPEYVAINSFRVGRGRFFTDREVRLMKRVAVLGMTVKKDLFGEAPALGRKIRIEGQSFLVIGVMEPKGQTSWRDPDDQIFVPVTTSQKRLFIQEYVSDIYIHVANIEDIPRVKREVERLLRARHRLAEGVESDFNIRDYTEFIKTLRETSQTFTVLLASIAAVSLIVGGIGVMNIMLVTVTERTREIGIRMAVGARGRDILRQFLVEALAITITGGLIGIGFGAGASWAISEVWGEWETVITPFSVALAFVFSALVGLVFGLYPAWKASRMDPIEALRYE